MKKMITIGLVLAVLVTAGCKIMRVEDARNQQPTQKDSERIEQIEENTAIIAINSNRVADNTGRIAAALEKIAKIMEESE